MSTIFDPPFRKEESKMRIMILFFLAAVFAAIGFTIVAEIHGSYQDTIKDSLHNNCCLCKIYRYLERDNAAFAVREKRRSERAAR